MNTEPYRKALLSKESLGLYNQAAHVYDMAKGGELPFALARAKFQEVCDLCHRIDRKHPDAIDNLHLWARAAFERGEYVQSIHLLERALNKANDHAALWYSYAYAHLALREVETAQTAFNTAIRIDPNETRADLGVAHCYFLKEDWVSAFQHYRALHTKYPQDIFVKQQIISVLSKLKADEYNPELESDLICYLSFNGLDVEPLSFFAASLFKHKWLQETDQPFNIKKINGEHWWNDPLLNAMLEKVIICDARIETLIIHTREHLLLTLLQQQEQLTPEQTQFCLNLALHQQRTEHSLQIPAKEKALIHEVSRLIDTYCLTEGKPITPLIRQFILMYSCYEPIQLLESFSTGDHSLLNMKCPNDWEDWQQRFILEPQAISRIAKKIPKLSKVHAASEDVQTQYEQNPYPRWCWLPARSPNDYGRALKQQLMNADLPSDLQCLLAKPELNVLVAGCGTGRHALHLAQNFEQLQVTAIDISRQSLAYAQYKARQLNASQVAFYQADILTLPSKTLYDIIECSGVLHHMNNPLLGLKRLVELLKPGGIIKLGLYSQKARSNLLTLRKGLKAHCCSDLPANRLRDIRASLMVHAEEALMAEVLASPDFFSLSGFRDLLLHVAEQDYTPKGLNKLIKSAGLEFLGFSNLSEQSKLEYREAFPDDYKGTRLSNWNTFEDHHPQTFGHMYQFFCYKPK